MSGTPVSKKLLLNSNEISYLLKFSKRAKYMRMQISRGSNLEVILPKGYSEKDAERFLNIKRDWISKHIIFIHPENEKYFFLGEEIKVVQHFDLFVKKHRYTLKDNELIFKSPSESKATPKALYNTWIKTKAKVYISNRVLELSRKHNFFPKKITIRNQKTRWGSCSSKGSLSFNYFLLKFKPELIDYVIIHELCHLRQMNHSELFWKEVENILPNYKILRRELKRKPIAA